MAEVEISRVDMNGRGDVVRDLTWRGSAFLGRCAIWWMVTRSIFWDKHDLEIDIKFRRRR